ncbi:L-rhamnose isomerase [candidate division KSB3 bacterium]|uniref:L-rhamnose isomerase n=1 Tax=candidate division KSB3 bacterium TaxID=2044937 RepID=A0A9D5JVJ6_9BACT|nr:L-rhamnose isomerase [candidate division KSB3 bacterium]MBD3324934.1 L-rhamnose isomerase [candidate division KSB3 bacterium]
MHHDAALKVVVEKLTDQGIDVEKVKSKLKQQQIELPSWGFSDSGTRFQIFRQPGVPRTIYEKFDDAAYINKLTGLVPSVAIHIPWDKTDDWAKLKAYVDDLGLKIGAVNPNLFQEQEYKLGALPNEDPAIRQKALEHHFECIEIMNIVGSKYLSLWYADGTNFPGQGSFTRRKHYFEENLKAVYAKLAPDQMLLLEYKCFEPAFYHTDIPDWGTSYCFCLKLGDRAQVLVDLGHHLLGTNIEHIVAILIDEHRLGGFHFNNKKYADDDLTVGSINPYELYLIYVELVNAEERFGDSFQPAYMVDQCHNLKQKHEAMVQTLMTLQTAYAKALIVDRPALEKAQKAGNVVEAERIVVNAFNADVEPLLQQIRIEKGLPPDPLQALRESGYIEKVIEARKDALPGQTTGWA